MTMSKQALESERVREGLKDVLLGPAELYEALREKADQQPVGARVAPKLPLGPATGCVSTLTRNHSAFRNSHQHP
jgi:hypothetical protein